MNETHREFDPEPPIDPPRRRRRGLGTELQELLGQVAIPLATALAVWLFLRDQVLDAYVVPTASMEPTIEGDPRYGDRVIVDKTFDERSRPERFDLVVFWLENEEQIVVKRVAGLPAESIEIRAGDLFVGPDPQHLERVVKSICTDADLVARYWDSTIDPNGFASRRWRRHATRLQEDGSLALDAVRSPMLPDEPHADPTGATVWNLEFLGKVTTGYLDAFGQLQERSYPALDFGVDLDVELEKGARLWLRLDKWGQSLVLCLGTGGLLVGFLDGHWIELGPTALPELAGGRHRVRAMWLDGGLVLAIDETEVFRAEPELRPDRRAPANGLALAVSGGAARIERLAVVRDLHWLERGRFAVFSPEIVPPEHYFLLGDNSEDSRDSRYFGPVHERWLRGRPLLIAAPFSRFQVFRR